MRLQLALALGLLVPFTAGCIGGGGEELDENELRAALVDPLAAIEAGQPAANLDVVGEWRDGSGSEADVWGELVAVDRGNELVILNVSDPREIVELSVTGGFRSIEDLKFSDDGRFVFVADDSELSEQPLAGTGPFSGGIYVLDIADPAAPSLVNFHPVGIVRGPHMAFYHQLPDGSEYVYGAAGHQVAILEFDREAGTFTQVASYIPGPTAQNPDPRVLDVFYGVRSWVHDMFVMTEADNSSTMYVAAWDAGLHVVDVTDPANPTQLGSWNDFGEGEVGNLHTVVTNWIGERRITVGAVEVGFFEVGGPAWVMGEEPSVLYVWDTTDPSDIQLLATWLNPIDPTSGRTSVFLAPVTNQFGERVSSTHNVQLENDRAYLAHYALGVWVIDLRDPSAPETLAYYMEPESSIWDVVLNNGVMYQSGSTGIVGLSFPLDPIGPAGTTSRA